MIFLKLFRLIRWKFFTLVTKAYLGNHMGTGVKVNHYCKFTSKTVIGNNSHFNGIKISGRGEVIIGENFHSGVDVRIITSNHNYDNGNSIPYDNTWVDKNVVIEDNVWVGERVIILGGVILGEGCVIQAGSVVVSNVPPLAIVGGHPAKQFKTRDREHYEKLKRERKFF